MDVSVILRAVEIVVTMMEYAPNEVIYWFQVERVFYLIISPLSHGFSIPILVE